MKEESGSSRRALDVSRHALKRIMPPALRQQVKQAGLGFANLGQIKRNQASLALHLAMLEAQQGNLTFDADQQEVPDSRFPSGIRSRLCTQAQLSEPWFYQWIWSMGERPRANRKAWEWAYIAHVLDSVDMLKPGRTGLGFGVGHDPLVPLFAARGVELMATDLDAATRQAKGWMAADQHVDTLDSATWPDICDEEQFKRLVSTRAVDMRAIPSDIGQYDFCWSACALEHLGSLPAGLEFVERSLSTVKPGGIAVHTTEYNVHSNDETVETGPCVVYRERDIRALAERLEDAGHEVAALDLSPGEGVLDHYVDLPPFDWEACLKFLFASYTLTSVALVIRTKP
ncbi:MAG TPA: hypothetical protein VG346_06125 [Acidimicrobiales bacterium]|nr:hypothetical protein [Acidimicrobiales bacterium]